MPNAMGGVQRALARLRPLDRNRSLTVRRLRRRAVGITRALVDQLIPVPTKRPTEIRPVAPRHLASHRDVARASRFRLQRRLIKVRLGSDRALPMAIAIAVIAAGIVSLGPNAVRPVGAAQGASQQVRIAIGGGTGGVDFDVNNDPTIAANADQIGAYVSDGTFYKPVAVDTIVESGSSLLRHYTVRSGDTLTGIASHFGVSMMTIWWANKLTSKDSLHQGETLVIPPVNGLIVTVKAGDSLDSLGAQYNVDSQAIMDLNNLTDPILVAGQVLVLPGAKGAPIPVPKVTYHPRSVTVSTRPLVYTSGAWAWPVVGGGNYVSQYFSSYHLGVDIASKYGTPIVAARAGTVVFKGWKAGGGGYQVWISHGSNLYTVYLHMSAMLVSSGQYVVKGQQIGRVGMTGNATGPHCHFGVSIGFPWQPGSYFVNPLRYF